MRMIYNILLRLLLSAAGLGLAAVWLDGVHVDRASTLFWAALWLGISNIIVRPVLVLLTLPISILTLGLFLLVINAAMLLLVAWILPGLAFSGFWAALGAWFLIAVLQAVGNLILGKNRLVLKVESRHPDDR